MVKIVSLLLSCLLFVSARAQEVTWAGDVACIIYSHCGSCHNPGGIATKSLASYTDAYNNRLAIEIYTYTGYMPPSLPDAGYSHLTGSKKLTRQEIELISAWALGNAERGDSTLEPAPPAATLPVSTMLNPDLSVRIPDFVVPDSAGHYRRCFVLTPPLSSRKIKAIEVVPGNPSAVHGVYLFADVSSTSSVLDASEPGPGYTKYFGIGSATAKPLYGWVPGHKVFTYPGNINLSIDNGSRIIVQVEYAENAGGKTDSTRVNILFDTAGSARQALILPLLNHDEHLLSGPLAIPVDTILTFRERAQVTNPVSLLSISPGLHHVCTSMEVYAVRPGNDTVGLLKIANWDPAISEGTYHFKNPVHLPQGSVLHAAATFNNTESNLHDPEDTLHDVHAGIHDEDEEMIFYFSHLAYQPGDENLVIDSLGHLLHPAGCKPVPTGLARPRTIAGFTIYPNPSATQVHFVKYGTFSKPYTLHLFTTQGKEIYSETVYSNNFTIDVSSFSAGLYVARISCDDGNFVYKISKE